MSKTISTFNPLIVLIFLGVLSVAAGGCGVRQVLTGELKSPQVTLQALTINIPTSKCWPLSATLLLTNPNSQPLEILGYDYKVYLEGKDVVQGTSQESTTVPAGGQGTMTLPIFLKLGAVPKALSQLLLRNRVNYQITGGIRLGSLLGGLRVPFQFQGKLTPQEGLEFLQKRQGDIGDRQ
jgi:LEA14-like dessication related protein